jgi:hypothetical protein
MILFDTMTLFVIMSICMNITTKVVHDKVLPFALLWPSLGLKALALKCQKRT